MLAQLNRDFESNVPPPPTVWEEWLWGSDPHEKLTVHVQLNKSHLLGILVARYRARYHPEFQLRLSALWPQFVHGHDLVSTLSLRQLRDSMEDLQMHWAQYTEDWDKASQALDALIARFGALIDRPQCLRDDPASLDPTTGRIGAQALRRFATLFLILYRHVELAFKAQELDSNPPHPGIETFHVEAGLDDFYNHRMLADSPPASRLIYKQDFAGMYNCVSQVVYMHFPNYERKRQKSLEEIRTGLHHVNTLSCILQLYPEWKMAYEDEMLGEGWTWVLLAGGTVYLVGPGRNEVLVARNIYSLMRLGPA